MVNPPLRWGKPSGGGEDVYSSTIGRISFMSHPTSRRTFLGGALAAGVSTALLAVARRPPRVRCREQNRRSQDQAGPDRLRRTGPVAGRVFPTARRLRNPCRGRLLPRIGPTGRRPTGSRQNGRFSGLDGYKRLLQSGVEAVAVVNVPRFHAEHARAAIEAGCHVYAAKPVAIDVPRGLDGPGGGQAGHAEEALLPGRLPDAHRSREHRGRAAGARRRPRPADAHREPGHLAPLGRAAASAARKTACGRAAGCQRLPSPAT